MVTMDKTDFNSYKIVKSNVPDGISPYHLVDIAGNEIKLVNEYLDSLAVRGLSQLTMRTYAFDLLNLWIWLAKTGIKLEDVTKKLLIDYIAYQRQSATPAAVTINHRLAVADCLYQYHFDRRIPSRKDIDDSPRRYSNTRVGWIHPVRIKRLSTRVKVPYKIIIPLTQKEVSDFFSSLNTWRDLSMAGFMLFCGLRSKEVINIKLSDINTDERYARVLGKGNKERIVPLADDLLGAVGKYLRLERPKTDSQVLFVVLKGQNRGQPLTKAAFRTVFRYHRRISGIYNANPHRFRHTFGANMTRAGVSLIVLMRLMGHTHVRTTIQYVNLSASDIRTEFNKAITKLNIGVLNVTKTNF